MKRNKLRKLLALGLSASLALTVLAGCSTTTGDDTGSPAPDSTGSPDTSGGAELAADQTFTFAAGNDLMTLDVAQVQDEMSALVLYATSEGLLRYYNGEVIPGIAETYDVSEDGTVYTFHLRDALWSDGEPVTAGDFEYAFLRMLDPATGSPQVEYLAPVTGAEDYYSGVSADASAVGIVAQDDKTLVITLDEADPFFLEQLAQGINFYPVRQDYVEQYGASYGSSPETYIGCGPFVLTEWVQSASITMARNENYWNKDAVSLTKVTELIVGDENTRVGMYNLGEVDAIYSISATQTLSFPNYRTKSGGTVQHLVFQSSKGSIMSNKNLRLALSWAIDRQSIVSAVASPGTEVTDNLLDPTITLDGESVAANYPASTGIPANGDLDKAKEYLQAALDELGLASSAARLHIHKSTFFYRMNKIADLLDADIYSGRWLFACEFSFYLLDYLER